MKTRITIINQRITLPQSYGYHQQNHMLERKVLAIADQVHNQLIKYFPVKLSTFDCSDAYDAQKQMIIFDKFKYHASFDNESVIMVQSLLPGRKSKCIINGMHSGLENTLSRPYQGSPPAAVIWCVYSSPLLKHIEKKCVLQDPCSNIIANIKTFGYMADLTIIMNIIQNYPFIDINGRWIKKIPKHVHLFQQTVDTVTFYFSINYFSINNIPQNENKTHFMTITEYGYSNNDNNVDNQYNNNNLSQWINNRDGNPTKLHNNTIKKTQSQDPNQYYRIAQFSISERTYPQTDTITILGVIFDSQWSSQLHVTNITHKTKITRINCKNMIKTNRNSINMDTIATIIKNAALSSLSHLGNAQMYQQANLD